MTANTLLAAALAPLAARMPRVVRHREILRVAGTLAAVAPSAAASEARRQALRWAQKRCGGRLPEAAWAEESFEYLAGGRTSLGIRFQDGNIDLWALRAEDPDKAVAQRHWTTEVAVGLQEGHPARFSLRLLASSPEEELEIEPHTPGLVRQVAQHCHFSVTGMRVSETPEEFLTLADGHRLADFLEDASRCLPVFVASLPAESAAPLIDAPSLAKATLGLAITVIVSAEASWALTERFGKRLSVFGGAVRIYQPGFTEDANPYGGHELILASQLDGPDAPARCVAALRRFAANASLRRFPLGRDVLSFAEIRGARLQLQSDRLKEAGADQDIRLQTAEAQIKALRDELESAKADQQWISDEHKAAEARAETAERQLNAAAYRIEQLVAQLKDRGGTPDTSIALPSDWGGFTEWCETNLIGRVLLSPRARRECRSPMYKDVQAAARCLLWLANTYREARRQGGKGDLQVAIEPGIENERCGADSFDFDWQQSRFRVEWHIKNGGNTRDPGRCLRIYYFWDEASQQVVIASMPAHLRTGAT